jgi:cob(I)alamin adenosyltransferase
MLHVARCVARRAERRAVALAEAESSNPQVVAYINRLSDLLFVIARVANGRAHRPEELVDFRTKPQERTTDH